MAEDVNPKKEQILKTAKLLFYKFGIRRVSIEEICREAGVSKMTYYKNFKNKNDIVLSILDRMMSDGINEYKQIMAQDVPFHVKVHQSIELKMRQTKEISLEFFNELQKLADEEILTFMNKTRQETLQLVYNDYIEAQKNGDIRSDIKPEFIIYFLNHMGEMAEDNRLVQMYDSPQALIIELTNFFFYGVLPRDN